MPPVQFLEAMAALASIALILPSPRCPLHQRSSPRQHKTWRRWSLMRTVCIQPVVLRLQQQDVQRPSPASWPSAVLENARAARLCRPVQVGSADAMASRHPETSSRTSTAQSARRQARDQRRPATTAGLIQHPPAETGPAPGCVQRRSAPVVPVAPGIRSEANGSEGSGSVPSH